MPGCASQPSLYVYELPRPYQDPRGEVRRGRNVSEAAASEGRSLPGFPLGAQLRNMHMFATADHLFARAKAYSCHVRQPARAQLFFVPVFSPSFRHNHHCGEGEDGVGSLYRRLAAVRVAAGMGNGTAVTALEARGGADHMFMSGRNGVAIESVPACELDLRDRRLGSSLRLSIESGRHNAYANYPTPYASLPMYHSVPPVAVIQLDGRATALPWATPHERTTLVAASFLDNHGGALRLRKSLTTACKAAPQLCTFVHPELRNRTERGGRNSEPTQLLYEEVARAYWGATFCLQPPGDSLNRKAIVDSMLLGCIPVLFHPGQALLWPWHWGSWQRASSVLLPFNSSGSGALAALESIPIAKVETMRRTIAQQAHRVHWAAVDASLVPVLKGLQPRDAFEITLDQAAKRADRSGLAAHGAKLQQQLPRLTLELAAVPRSAIGHCGSATTGEGDCEHGDMGSWYTDATRGNDTLDADTTLVRLATLDDCAARCESCARCNFVSHSYRWTDCSWHHRCPRLHRQPGNFITANCTKGSAGAPKKCTFWGSGL